MTAREIVHSLERMGYTLTVVNGRVRGDRQDLLPPPPEAPALLDQLRQHKGEILDILLYRGFTAISATEGDLHVITVDISDEREMLRWSLAIDTGLIVLVGKILYRTGPDTATIRYRCAFPPEWLPDEINRAAKQKYNHTLMRIQKGKEWLQGHDEDHPEYDRCHAAYLALNENLHRLHIVIGEPLDDLMTGYGEVAAT